MPDRPRTVDRLLPLKPKVLHILLSLADGPRHGYAIMQDVAASTDGHVRVWPAAMYGIVRELQELDWILESQKRPDDDDERRRYYELTPLGKRVLSGEIRRLEAIVDHARASRALRSSNALKAGRLERA
jgi:DNA-binding PadR family transcriptional regulator